jgi:hypothetical protein
VHFGASVEWNIDALFFLLGWAWCGFHKNRAGHITPNLCFCIRWYLRVTYSILVRPGHETSMHYFLYSGGISKGSAKSGLGHITPNLSFLHPVGSVGDVVHSGAFGVRIVDALFFLHGWACGFQKKRGGTHYAELGLLHPVGYVGHVVHFGASGVGNVDAVLYILEWDQYGLHKKCAETVYVELVFLHPVGFTGHVVHSAAFGVRNIDTLFFVLRWDR